MAPLTLYLDSQDYIRFTDERSTPKVSEVFAYLRDARVAGKVRVGCSYLHIVEVLNPDSAGFSTQQREYGRQIASLANFAFPFISDLFSGVPVDYQNQFWGPQKLLSNFKDFASEKGLQKIVREGMCERSGLTRQQRVRMSKPKQRKQLLASMDLPLPPLMAASGVTSAELKGLILNPPVFRKAVSQKIVKWLSDPVYYSEVISTLKPGQNPLDDALKELEEPVHAKLLALIEHARSARKAKDELVHTYKEQMQNLIDVDRKESDYFRKLRREYKALRKQKLLKDVRSDNRLGHPRFGFLNTYLGRIANMEKPPSLSEVRDIYHLFYAHECDLVRVDRRMAEILKSDRDLSGKLIRSYSDIPNAVENALQLSRK